MQRKSKEREAPTHRKPADRTTDRRNEARLDEALDESFPASDPAGLTPKRG